MFHELSAQERIDFLNDMIHRDIQRDNEASKDWMVQEFKTYRFYHPANYNHDTDEKIHRYMDRTKVPGKIPLHQWNAYKESKQ